MYAALWLSAILVFICGLLFERLRYAQRYWKRKNVLSLRKPNIIFGNTFRLIFGLEHYIEFYGRIYEQSVGERYVGYYSFQRPIFVVKDPELIRNVFVRDFEHFQDRGLDLYSEREPLTHHLFNLEYGHWKPLRKKLAPAFTTGKIKSMFVFVSECCDVLRRQFDDRCNGTTDSGVEIKDTIARLTTDVISSCAFGVAADSLTNPDSKFRKMGERIFKPRLEILLKMLIKDVAPFLPDMVGLRFFEKDVTNFFSKSVSDMIAYRESNNVIRGDFLDLLIAMKKTNSQDGGLEMSLEMITAQCFLFFAAGFETSSSTISFSLLELARNSDVLTKVQREVDSACEEYNGQLTYEALQKLNYLEMVISETLRMYPPLYVLSRKCTLAYTIPGTSTTIEKGTEVIIPVYSIQHDSQYFPNPEVFDPENFSVENKSLRHPFCYLPFGEGPRICIGLKFGMMQTKLAIATLINKYDISLSEKMEFPLKFVKVSFVTNNVGGIWLKFAKRKK